MAHILHILIFSIPGQNIYFCMVYTRDTDSIYTIILLLANCRSQFLLDRLGRCLKLFVSTESTSCHEFASQFGLEFFISENTQNLGETGPPVPVFISMASDQLLSPAERAVTVGWATYPSNSDNLNDSDGGVCVGVCTRTCVHACLRDVFAIYDNNI